MRRALAMWQGNIHSTNVEARQLARLGRLHRYLPR